MGAAKISSELTVAILPLGQISDQQITLTSEVLQQEFSVKTLIMPPEEIPDPCLDAGTGHCLIDKLFVYLALRMPMEAQKIICIVDAEISSNGQIYRAMTNRNWGVVFYSIARLTKDYANHPDSKTKIDCASLLIVSHEFGHALGLAGHCDNDKCIMRAAATTHTPCENCQRHINRELRVKPDSAETYFARAETLQEVGALLPDKAIFEVAVALYRQAVAQAKHEPHYHHRLALALAKNGQLAESKQAELLAGIFSQSYPQFSYLFALNALEKNPDEAEKLFAKAITEAKDKQHIHKIIGNAYREIARNTDKALHHYREYFRLGGDDQTIVEWYNSRLRDQNKS